MVVPRGEGAIEFLLVVSDEAESASCRRDRAHLVSQARG